MIFFFQGIRIGIGMGRNMRVKCFNEIMKQIKNVLVAAELVY